MYSLTEVLPHVYRVHFENHYQLVMHFLRLQDYYESPKFADTIFTLVDLMEWYAGEYGKGVFTYPKDWSGFNVPDWVMRDVYVFGVIKDFNKYDLEMKYLTNKLFREQGGHPFYLIGTSTEAIQERENGMYTLDHELAHGMFYTNKEYRADVDQLLDDPKTKGRCWQERAAKALADMGYHQRTIRDEIHAYASTVPCKDLKDILTKDVCSPFIENFNKHLERCRSQS